MDGYVFAESIDEQMRERAVAMLFGPGDKVVLSSKAAMQATGRLRSLLSAGEGGVLTVASVRIDDLSQAFFCFEGVEGEFPNHVFTDPRPRFHVYGAMVRNDDGIWVVEMNPETEDTEAGRSVKVSGTTGRYLAWNDGIECMEDVDEYVNDGVSGEFVLLQEADGSWSLVAIPWSTGISEEEREAAEAALAAGPEAPKPAILN